MNKDSSSRFSCVLMSHIIMYAEIGGTGRQFEIMNQIKYKAGGKVHEITTQLSFLNFEENIIARKVFIEILEDSSEKLKTGEIPSSSSIEEMKVMTPEEIEDWRYISDIEFVDFTVNKRLKMNRMTDHINNYKIENL